MLMNTQTLEQLFTIYNNGRLAQSLLFLGDMRAQLYQTAITLTQYLLCLHHNNCGHCQSCQLIIAQYHPDLVLIQPEKANSLIKAEQVRDVYEVLFNSPQISPHRVILITAVDKMNNYAANALLKILEEPPSTVHFILLAEQISLVLPTIISRCQLWHFADPYIHKDYLSLIDKYGLDTERGQLATHLPNIIDALIDFNQSKISACQLASQWSKYPLEDLAWLLYLIYAETLRCSMVEKNALPSIKRLAETLSPELIFLAIDGLKSLILNLQHGIHVNHLLAIEKILVEQRIACRA